MAVDKQAILEKTLEAIRKKMPTEVIGKYSEIGKNMDVATLSTGSIAVDETIGGGVPIGRLIEIVGKASSGKTTLCLTIIANLQKEKPDAIILYVDAENALDPAYAKRLGVNLDDVIIIQPDNGEDGYDAAAMFVDSGIADLVVIDSIAAMIPKAMLEYELDEQPKIAMGATLDTRGVARLFNSANKTKTTVLLINQYRERTVIGMPTQGDGVSGTGYLPGGQSLPFYMSQILKIQRVGKVEELGEIVADQVRMWSIKNKIAPPYRTTDFYIAYNKGVDIAQEVIEYGSQYGFIFKTARTYAIINLEATAAARVENPEADVIVFDESRQTSRQKFVNYLNENKDILEDLKKKIQKELKDARESGDIKPAIEAIKEAEEMGAEK